MEGLIQKKALYFPLSYRLAEGLSVSMLLGYLCGGGSVFTPLGVVYAAHWIASINFHLSPSPGNFELDTHLIDLVTLERLFRFCGNPLVYPIFQLLLLSGYNQWHRYSVFVKVFLIVTYLALTRLQSVVYLSSWVLACVCFLLSDKALHHNLYLLSVVLCVLFHLCIGWTSYMEVVYYREGGIEAGVARIATFVTYVEYALHSIVYL